MNLTFLGWTFVIILVAVMLRDSEGTSRIIRSLAEAYDTGVNAFPIQQR